MNITNSLCRVKYVGNNSSFNLNIASKNYLSWSYQDKQIRRTV